MIYPKLQHLELMWWVVIGGVGKSVTQGEELSLARNQNPAIDYCPMSVLHSLLIHQQSNILHCCYDLDHNPAIFLILSS